MHPFERHLEIRDPHPVADVVVVDPPWPYYGSPTKMGAAGKEYSLMSEQGIYDFDIHKFRNPGAPVFVWSTSPKMNLAIHAISNWGLHYRGIAFVWIKTRRDGAIIGSQGVRATFTKPTTEFLLLATEKSRGRPIPLLTEKIPQVQLHPRLGHSEKPQRFYDLIRDVYGEDRSYVEVFARKQREGWLGWGDEYEG